MGAMKDKLMDDYLTALKFDCSCKGCRNWLPDIAGIVYPEQLAHRTEGYYFSRDTMRLFKSRYADWSRLTNSAAGSGRDNRDGVAVIVSSRHGYDGAARYYEVITICAWGSIHRGQNSDGLEQFETLRAARKELAAATYPAACSCHGCQLDRAHGLDRIRRN
jgi:hypothetical protein